MNSPLLALAADHVVFIGIVASVILGFIAKNAQNWFPRLFFSLATLVVVVPTVIIIAGQNPWVIEPRYRAYKQFYWSIGRAMTRENVMEELDKRYADGSGRLRPTIVQDSDDRLCFHMNLEGGGGIEGEEILLKMEAGRVVGKEYLPR